MLTRGKLRLPEWGFWPALPFAALIIVANVGIALPPPPQEIATNATKNNKAAKKPEDATDRLADYTFWLTCLTAGIVITGFLQIIVLVRADKTARMGVRTAARQTVITRRQMLISGAQTDLMVKQKEIARQQYLAVHRPKLRIRHITPTIHDGKPITVHCTVTNIGETNARIIWQEIMIAALPIGIDGKQGAIRLAVRDLDGGQSGIFLTEAGRGTTFLYSQEWNLGQAHQGVLVIRGAFIYVDENGVQRRIGFHRKYNLDTGRFDIVIAGEDEYED